eukprot:CAMPEP_0115844872 /NCGR_PEP_ID=MMETSP0287-20121206/9052_1 /TAXON_ID=412157 /ORGANISM="Chrysochromulina rotalis, Strain UIO044" /LENGTH=236 /DNA_ID=CAMNT_0003298611 /DNA_START=236 /DNA_END=946 /DNA_ORIENTATION=-
MTTDFNASESLLGVRSLNPSERDGFSRATRGRTSLDSTVSCIVCMDSAINCVLMPCAHEVACARCARRLQLCPVCRTAVDATMKIQGPTQEQLLDAALERARGQPGSGEMPPGAGARDDVAGCVHAGSVERPADTSALGSGVPARNMELRPIAADDDDVAANTQPGAAVVGDPAAAKPQQCEMLCLRCAMQPPNCVFLPCAHKVWCTECAEALPPACPICNTGIAQGLKTFHKRLG